MITICLTIIVCVIVICYAAYKINETNKYADNNNYSDMMLINNLIDTNAELTKKRDEMDYWDYAKSHETLLLIKTYVKTICKNI